VKRVKSFKSDMEKNYLDIVFPEDKQKLLFNSKNDKIILLDEILKLENKKNTDFVLYDNSVHVQHIKYHKDNYIDKLYNFIYN